MTPQAVKHLILITWLVLMVQTTLEAQKPTVPAIKLDKRAAMSKVGSDPVQQVQAAFDSYIDGWKRGDVEALSHVYANNARVTGIWPDPDQSYPVRGWPAIRAELIKVMEFTKGMDMYYSPRHVEVYGDVAIISTNWEWRDLEHSSNAGRPNIDAAAKGVFARGQGTFVFVRQKRHWILVHEHASVLPGITSMTGGK